MTLEDTFYITEHSVEPCDGNPNSVRNLLWNSFLINKISNAKSYQLIIKEVIDGDGYHYPGALGSFSWNQDSTQYLNKNPDENNGEFEINFFYGAINICNSIYGETVARLSATRAHAELIITLE